MRDSLQRALAEGKFSVKVGIAEAWEGRMRERMYPELNSGFGHDPNVIRSQQWHIVKVPVVVPRIDIAREVRNDENDGGESKLMKDRERILVGIQISIIKGDNDGVPSRTAIFGCAGQDAAYGGSAITMVDEELHLPSEGAFPDDVP